MQTALILNAACIVISLYHKQIITIHHKKTGKLSFMKNFPYSELEWIGLSIDKHPKALSDKY
ncbi:hypothetical protein [Scopulibacillus daqui]|uniref:hypothetical protein n=1 Tax=Scopulibacillus daqui TaxID=1469162 RepID=UPI001961F0BD|nr:hypothetical protein [Scopulibacillus daqui]